MKRSTASTETVKMGDAPPPKLFKHSHYEPFVIEQASPRALTPVIDRNAWLNESAGGGYMGSAGISFMGFSFIGMPIASAVTHGTAHLNPVLFVLTAVGAVLGPAGLCSIRRHAGRIRWVKQTSARRIRAWLSVNYDLHAGEIEPKVANRFLNQNKVGATMALIDDLSRSFTLYRVADGKYVVRDAQREIMAQLPAAEPTKALAAASGSAIKRLPRSTKALYEWSGVLHSTLAARSGLSPEHEHRIARAGEVLAEVNQMTAALTKRPTGEYVKNVEASLNSILRDMESVKDELDAALARQAAVLATFTREVTGR